MKPNLTPTMSLHSVLDDAYNFFNNRLFDGELPVCLITVQRKARSHGYFGHDMVGSRGSDARIDEIAMIGTSLSREPDVALSTLVHEMCHVWQQHYGKPAKGGYHNKEWAAKMEEIGLIPTATGEEGGAKTGKNMTHMIDPEGYFSIFCEEFLRERSVDWHLLAAPAAEKKKDLSKVLKVCPECGAKVWGKKNLFVMCGDCDLKMEEDGE